MKNTLRFVSFLFALSLASVAFATDSKCPASADNKDCKEKKECCKDGSCEKCKAEKAAKKDCKDCEQKPEKK